MLLTGDAGAEFERDCRADRRHAPLRILKVGHHGSRLDQRRGLCDALRPQIALVSVGRGNLFGHPAPDVLARLTRAGAQVFRTDRDGAISVETDGATRARADDERRGRWTRERVRVGRRLDRAVQAASISVERRVVHRSARALEPVLERVEPRGELVVGRAQRGLGLEAELAREIRDREEQVAQFLGGARRALVERLAQLARLPRRSCRSRRRACGQSKPTAATRVPISCARSSAGSARGTPESTRVFAPAAACSRALICSHCSSTARRRARLAPRAPRRRAAGPPA